MAEETTDTNMTQVDTSSSRAEAVANEPGIRRIEPHSLAPTFRSKYDMYRWWKIDQQLVLPRYKDCNLSNFVT